MFNSAGEQECAYNAACPTHDVDKFTSRSPSPPPHVQQAWSKRAVSSMTPRWYLRRMRHYFSRVGGGEAGTPPILFASEHRPAPASAESINSVEGRQAARRGRVRFKSVGSRISLGIVVGALLFDVYLLKVAFLRETRKKSSSSSTSDGSSYFGPKEPTGTTKGKTPGADKSRVPYHLRFPLFPPRNAEGEDADTSIWDRVADIGDTPLFDRNGSPETGTERGDVPSNGRMQSNDDSHATGDELEQLPMMLWQRLPGFQSGDSNTDDSTTEPGAAHVPRPPTQPDPYGGQRVAVVVPYVGSDLPVWWDAFAAQAQLNEGLVDWIIFCDKVSTNCELIQIM